MSEGKTYDLAVIGSGTAAQVVSFRVGAAGWSVAVIDHLPFGGTRALRGCDPKKMLISGAEAIDMARRMRGRGATGELATSWPDLIAFKRTFTDPVPVNHERRYAERGIDAFHAKARFTGQATIEVDRQTLQARHVLIATGARPVPRTCLRATSSSSSRSSPPALSWSAAATSRPSSHISPRVPARG